MCRCQLPRALHQLGGRGRLADRLERGVGRVRELPVGVVEDDDDIDILQLDDLDAAAVRATEEGLQVLGQSLRERVADLRVDLLCGVVLLLRDSDDVVLELLATATLRCCLAASRWRPRPTGRGMSSRPTWSVPSTCSPTKWTQRSNSVSACGS